ncbi:Acetyltransferase, GNAT family [Fulvivirga imtechensis AK7]|uniref:Acetyltransferase, GNAT family n=1 Tax=Fulvivirga imtechensis AK7 TaxID=1237149 RepID=L8JRA4_9BACT|nr:GNAT family acetyltransferase [Fulvivirga imtechensis]ELR71506.1 Acetyltransferase, GNAT family [Fulvivirga imtechensis AK7]
MEIRIANIADIEGVLALQQLYLYDSLAESERKNGFVTTPFTPQQVEAVISDQALFIAVDEGKVVAYIFAGSWEFYSQWPIFPYMTSLFPGLTFKGSTVSIESSFQYGPICIDVSYRGSGLLLSLFEFMRQHMAKRYPLTATFINKVNVRSLKAHVDKLGWRVIGNFQYNDKDYWILAYDMGIPAVVNAK